MQGKTLELKKPEALFTLTSKAGRSGTKTLRE
jgi:hypothetical protein